MNNLKYNYFIFTNFSENDYTIPVKKNNTIDISLYNLFIIIIKMNKKLNEEEASFNLGLNLPKNFLKKIFPEKINSINNKDLKGHDDIDEIDFNDLIRQMKIMKIE
jgi:hypothetical protein